MNNKIKYSSEQKYGNPRWVAGPELFRQLIQKVKIGFEWLELGGSEYKDST